MNKNTVYPSISLKVFKEEESNFKMPLGIYHGYNECFCQKMSKINKDTTLVDIFEICLNEQEDLKKCKIYFSYIKIIARTFNEYINDDSPYKKIFEDISNL